MPRSNITRYSTIAALIAGASLFAIAAEALPAGVAPPWADQTTPSAPATAATPSAPAAIETTAPASQSAPPGTDTSPGTGITTVTATPVEVPVSPAGGTTTPASPVSMRAGPNTSFPVIGTLRPGMPLQILASGNYGWVQVQSPAGPGWVYGSYLAPSSTEPTPSPVTVIHP
ncbi:MAG TPA: SH3 domain-containing protein [Stellaceae bacterium]|nr:SH3 domain-containing protein [Stellaceae bacterium]